MPPVRPILPQVLRSTAALAAAPARSDGTRSRCTLVVHDGVLRVRGAPSALRAVRPPRGARAAAVAWKLL
jgi:hypothetical protein